MPTAGAGAGSYVAYSNNGNQPYFYKLDGANSDHMVTDKVMIDNLAAGAAGGDAGEYLVGEFVTDISRRDPGRTDGEFTGYHNMNFAFQLLQGESGLFGKAAGKGEDAFKGVDLFFSTESPARNFLDIDPSGTPGDLTLDFAAAGLFASSKASFQASSGRDNTQEPSLGPDDIDDVFGLVLAMWLRHNIDKLGPDSDSSLSRLYGQSVAFGKSSLDANKTLATMYASGQSKIANLYNKYGDHVYEKGAGSDITDPDSTDMPVPKVGGVSGAYEEVYDTAMKVARAMGINTITMNLGAYNLGVFSHGVLEDVLNGSYQNHRYVYVLRGKRGNQRVEKSYDTSSKSWNTTTSGAASLAGSTYDDHLATILTATSVSEADAKENVERQTYLAHYHYGQSGKVLTGDAFKSQSSVVVRPGDYQLASGDNKHQQLAKGQRMIQALKNVHKSLENIKSDTSYLGALGLTIKNIDRRKDQITAQITTLQAAASIDSDRVTALTKMISQLTAMETKLNQLKTYLDPDTPTESIVVLSKFFSDVITESEQMISDFESTGASRENIYIEQYNEWLRKKALFLVFDYLGNKANPTSSKPFTLIIGGETVVLTSAPKDPKKPPQLYGERRFSDIVRIEGFTITGAVVALLLGGEEFNPAIGGGLGGISLPSRQPDYDIIAQDILQTSPFRQRDFVAKVAQYVSTPGTTPVQPRDVTLANLQSFEQDISNACNAIMSGIRTAPELTDQSTSTTTVIRSEFQVGTMVKKLTTLRTKIAALRSNFSTNPPEVFTNFIYNNVIAPIDMSVFDPSDVTSPTTPEDKALSDRSYAKMQDRFGNRAKPTAADIGADSSSLGAAPTAVVPVAQRDASTTGNLASKISDVVTDAEAIPRSSASGDQLKIPDDVFSLDDTNTLKQGVLKQRTDAEAGMLKQNLARELYSATLNVMEFSFNSALIAYIFLRQAAQIQGSEAAPTPSYYDQIGGVLLEIALNNGDYKSAVQILNEMNEGSIGKYTQEQIESAANEMLEIVDACLEILALGQGVGEESEGAEILQFPSFGAQQVMGGQQRSGKVAAESLAYMNILKKLLYTAKKRR
jgi:hypothetical protein